MAADFGAADGTKTKHRRSLARGLRSWLWPIFRDFPRELLRIKLVRFVIAGTRYIWFVLILRRLRTATGAGGVAKSTIAIMCAACWTFTSNGRSG